MKRLRTYVYLKYKKSSKKLSFLFLVKYTNDKEYFNINHYKNYELKDIDNILFNRILVHYLKTKKHFDDKINIKFIVYYSNSDIFSKCLSSKNLFLDQLKQHYIDDLKTHIKDVIFYRKEKHSIIDKIVDKYMLKNTRRL